MDVSDARKSASCSCSGLMRILGLPGLLLIVGLLGGCGKNVIQPDMQLAQQVRNDPYADRDWAIVLRDHVRYGLVDYDTLQTNPEPLLRYVALLSACGPRTHPEQFPSRSHTTAYYINAYNALVLRAVLTRGDVPTMYDYSLPRIEYEYWFPVDGQVVCLADLEKVLLEQGGDIRVLFATSRAALGTPRLSNEPFRPETLDKQLTAATADALDLPEICTVNHASRSIEVWYAVLDHEAELVQYWKNLRRINYADPFNVLLELASPQKRRVLQSAVGYSLRPIAFDRTLNKWKPRGGTTGHPLVP